MRKQQLISSKGLSSLKKGVGQIGGEVFVTEKEDGYSIASSVVIPVALSEFYYSSHDT